MKRLLLIVLPLLLIVGCSKPISEETLIDKDGLKYHPETKELYSGEVFQNRMGGEKEFEGSYKDGKKDGKWTTWFENGQKEFEKNYKDGKDDELWTYWDKNDGKMYKGVFMNLDINDIDFSSLNGSYFGYEDGSLLHSSFKDGELDGLFTRWFDNGKKWIEGTFKDGKEDGLSTEWYENGQKREEEIFKDGKLISGKVWNEDGSVRE
jgi:antitoxin component YwqK of YwqJK toxin-antitoxin module